ncbi:MAG: helix-turn-helix domain-containing protein [Candidatus Hodarchaeota archaeon]
MMVIELRIKIQHDNPHLSFSESFSDTEIFGYCNSKFDILMIPAKITNSNLEAANKNYAQNWKITSVGNPGSVSYITTTCLCDKTINSKIQQQGGISIYPIRYSGGWGHYQIVCLDSSDLSSVMKVLQAYPQMNVISIKEFDSEGIFPSQMISMPEITKGLTDHQLVILIRAFECGYYEIPRKIRTEDLADEFQVSRYAVEKTLRKAENNLLTALMPYLLLKKNSAKN